MTDMSFQEPDPLAEYRAKALAEAEWAKRRFQAEYPAWKDDCWHYKEVEEVFKFEEFQLGIAIVIHKESGMKGTLAHTNQFGARVYYHFLGVSTWK